MVVRIILSPTEGWGYSETLDGELAAPFHAEIDETGVDCGSGILGWKGRAVDGKYSGAPVEMTPRLVSFNGLVVLHVGDRGKLLFSGIADSNGLECTWQ